MARAERLQLVIDSLRGREGLTSRALAEELGISLRTLRRDLATLRERGLTIVGDAGPGGGVRMERDRGVATVHFTRDEVVALWLAAHLSAVGSALPWNRAARSGLEKLFASVPRERARELRALCKRVVVGPPASEEIRREAREPPPGLLGRFEEAFTARIGLGFAYSDRHGAPSQRRVEPHGLLVQPPVWYVLARDVEKRAPRTFRMDRMARVQLLDDVRFVPDAEVVRSQTRDLLGATAG